MGFSSSRVAISVDVMMDCMMEDSKDRKVGELRRGKEEKEET
jgi:hypothetical protein